MARRRPAARKPSSLAGRDSFHVVGLPGPEITKAEAAHALTAGQRRAEQHFEPVTATIERRSLFGPTTTLYRIDRDEHGTVRTTPVDAQD